MCRQMSESSNNISTKSIYTILKARYTEQRAYPRQIKKLTYQIISFCHVSSKLTMLGFAFFSFNLLCYTIEP